MVDMEYANAYSEVLEILKYMSKENYNKIPKSMIEVFNKNNNKNYKFKYDINKTLDEQNVSKKAKTIIAILFRDYWATEKQREKILAKEKYDMQKIEKEKYEKYNPEDMFKNKGNIACKTGILDLVIQKEKETETMYGKFISIIKQLWGKLLKKK